ncbi:hypothetical protein tb265_42950 [Gemmatimonadetes bacterium T265]|nr:hypothetical protein tb265_42950 [Gemmatimonadetes bacterium T265]
MPDPPPVISIVFPEMFIVCVIEDVWVFRVHRVSFAGIQSEEGTGKCSSYLMESVDDRRPKAPPRAVRRQ